MAGAAITERILKETLRAFSKPREALYQSNRGQINQARLVAVSLARELSGLRLTEIAEVFRVKSYRTVASSCYRLKKLMERDPGIKRQYVDIHQRCSQRKI